MDKIKVYLIAKIAEEYHRKNERVSNSLDSRFEVFIPHKNNPFNIPHAKLESKVAEIDYREIDKADIGLICEPFGEDCSCEIGYFKAKGKPTVLYAENVGDWLNHWMAKYAITSVAASNKEIETILREDPIFRDKEIALVQNNQELSDFVYDIAITQPLIRKIKSLERKKQEELSGKLEIYGMEAKVITGDGMAKLHRQADEQGLEIPTEPFLAKARVESDDELREFLWRYDWLSSSALSRVQHKGKDYGVFTHVNPFDSEEKRIQSYEKSTGKEAVQLNEEDAKRIFSMEDGKDVIVVPFKYIIDSPRGKIPLRDIVYGDGHVVAMGAFGNDKQLLDAYVERYIDVMQKSKSFTPTEMGIWFSENAKLNTLRPIELGDSGIGIYNRNLTNNEYRTLALRK